MSLHYFLDSDNERYQIQVIAPTFTYGTMFSLNSKYDFEIDFDEYDDSIAEWEFMVLIDGKIIASFNSLVETREYIKQLNI